MYNTSIVCVYSDLSSYQKVLLDIFDTNFNGLLAKVQTVYDHVKHHEKVQALLKKVNGPWESLDIAFCVLFSYEYLEHTHRFLCELLTDQPLTSYDALYTLL
jgi:hypothetical protein